MKLQVIIIGGGPAGISCGIWLKKLGVRCVVLESAARLGGLQTRSPYENLWIPGVQGRTGQEVAQGLADHAVSVGVDVRLTCPALDVTASNTLVTPTEHLSAPFLVIATGTRPRSGGFSPSETIAIGPGAAMEAMPVAGRRIAILGGGDNAFDQARFVQARGGTPVIFSRAPPRAQRLLQDMIPDVEVAIGDYHADAQSLRVNDTAFDGFAVMYGFEAVVPKGLTPDLDNGYVRVDRWAQTSLPGVYACGEVTDYWHPCVTTAAAHGIQVAKQIALKLAG